MIPQKAMEAIARKCGSDPEAIAAGIDAAVKLERMVLALERDAEDVKRGCLSRVREINDEIAAIRAKCEHPGAAYQGDPSGGNDSSQWCQVCGLVW